MQISLKPLKTRHRSKKSTHCHLTYTPQSLLPHHNEEPQERGGYFVVNGKERLIRLLLAQRRNFFLCLSRKSFRSHGSEFTPFAVAVRSVREDCHSVTLYAHYLATRDVKLRFSLRRRPCLVPAALLLKCLGDVSDRAIFLALVGGAEEGDVAAVAQTADVMLRRMNLLRLNGRRECLAYLGRVVRAAGLLAVSAGVSDFEAGRVVIEEYLFVHCYSDRF